MFIYFCTIMPSLGGVRAFFNYAVGSVYICYVFWGRPHGANKELNSKRAILLTIRYRLSIRKMGMFCGDATVFIHRQCPHFDSGRYLFIVRHVVLKTPLSQGESEETCYKENEESK